MYSDKHRCIFVHQRKAAGTSIKALFDDAMPGFNNGILDACWGEDQQRVASYFKFTVVRNPWDRFVSGWKYLKSTRDRSIEDVLENLPSENLLKNIFFDRSHIARCSYAKEMYRRQSARLKVKAKNTINRTSLKLPHNQGHDYRHITRQQCTVVIDAEGRLVVDAVMYMERLHEDLVKYSGQLGIDPSKLTKINQNRRGDDYRQYFNSRALELFNQHFADDVRILNYDFDKGPGVAPNSPNLR